MDSWTIGTKPQPRPQTYPPVLYYNSLTNAPFEQEVAPLTRSTQWQSRLLYLGHFIPSGDAKDLCRSLNELGPHKDMFFSTILSWYNCVGRIRQGGLGKRCDPEAVFADSKPRPFPVTSSLPSHL